jgi:hypothetical protein
MTVIERIAFYQGRRDEVPNQDLARDLASRRDTAGIAEIASGLFHKEANVRNDCLKVLYEIGYLDPALVGDYSGEFVRLLKSRNNRLVWGAMIALSTIAGVRAAEIYAHLPEILKAMQSGSVITVDNAIKTLALLGRDDAARRREVAPILLRHLATCRPKDVPQHAESSLPAVDAENKAAFIQVLEKRRTDLSAAQLRRVNKVIALAGKV